MCLQPRQETKNRVSVSTPLWKQALSRGSERVGFDDFSFNSIHETRDFRKSVFVQKRGGFARSFTLLQMHFPTFKRRFECFIDDKLDGCWRFANETLI